MARRFRLLSKAAAEYDAGDHDQIAIIAGLLRILLTDRLVDHAAPLDQLEFSDTTYRLPATSPGGYGYGLARILHDPGPPDSGRIVAPLGGQYQDIAMPTVAFPDWWKTDKVIYPTNRPVLTREYVVYEMANTDGLHIDTELDEDYDALTRDNYGFTINGLLVTGNVAHASVRQIAWETQHTLHRALPHICPADYPSSFAHGDYYFIEGTLDVRVPSPPPGKVPRS